MKILGNKPISQDECTKIFDGIDALIRCHDSLVTLYDEFMKDPMLFAFYHKARRASHIKHGDDEPKVYIMKQAIRMMASCLISIRNGKDVEIPNPYVCDKSDITPVIPKPPKVKFKPTSHHIVLTKSEGDDKDEQETEKEV